ncbi:MAG: hypothetical protein ACI8VE_002796, partial [Natrialbaceae archaeon]
MVQTVSLYRAPTTVLDVDSIASWLDDRIEATVQVRGRFFEIHRSENHPERFANARVLDPYDRETGNTMLGIVRYEERVLEDPQRGGGVLYNGLEIQRALCAAIP